MTAWGSESRARRSRDQRVPAEKDISDATSVEEVQGDAPEDEPMAEEEATDFDGNFDQILGSTDRIPEYRLGTATRPALRIPMTEPFKN